jgi:hypothetical protein
MLWLLRSFVRLSKPVALVGAALFTLSNVYYISAGHAQLVTVVFISVFASLVLSSWREPVRGAGRSIGRVPVACQGKD